MHCHSCVYTSPQSWIFYEPYEMMTCLNAITYFLRRRSSIYEALLDYLLGTLRFDSMTRLLTYPIQHRDSFLRDLSQDGYQQETINLIAKNLTTNLAPICRCVRLGGLRLLSRECFIFPFHCYAASNRVVRKWSSASNSAPIDLNADPLCRFIDCIL